jgi:aryl-alcohol dehydrogenase-like predicted oxidoreductase
MRSAVRSSLVVRQLRGTALQADWRSSIPLAKELLMMRGFKAIGLSVAMLMALPLLTGTHQRTISGTAWAASDTIDEAKVKSLEALEAIARALQDFAKKAQAEAQQAAEQVREQVRTSVEKACDTSLRACQKVCGDDAKCLNACKEGRKQCQS